MHRKQLRAVKHSFKTWQMREKSSDSQEHGDGKDHDAHQQFEAESAKGDLHLTPNIEHHCFQAGFEPPWKVQMFWQQPQI